MSSPLEENTHARAQDELASLALGESVDPALAEHVTRCAVCRDEVAAYRRVIDLAKDGDRTGAVDEQPPPYVWERIAGAVAGPERSAPVVPLARWRRLQAGWLAVAAAVLVIAAGVAGWALGRDTDASPPAPAAQAALRAQPGTPGVVHGTAALHRSSDGARIDVSTRGLPNHNGYYEVWLYDPSDEIMVPIGTLGAGGRGTFSVPAGVDLARYHVVDVSAQNFGTVEHQRSVLQGSLPR